MMRKTKNIRTLLSLKINSTISKETESRGRGLATQLKLIQDKFKKMLVLITSVVKGQLIHISI